MSEYLIEVINVTKTFKESDALESVNLKLQCGKICALVGENGSGKSLLANILSGIVRPDAGSIYISGKKINLNETGPFIKYGITTIYQDINLIEELTVAENIFLRNLSSSHLKIIDKKTLYKESEIILRNLNFDIDPMTKVKDLNIGQKRIVEIAKAISQESKLIIFDEPCICLSENELESFYNVLRKLREKGTSIIFITHRLSEVIDLCDCLTVLNEGKIVVDGLEVNNIDQDRIVKLMAGDSFKDVYPKLSLKLGRMALKVDDVSTDRNIENISFELKKREILGIAGLLGSGRTAISRAIYGLDNLNSGSICINGKKIHINSPKDAVKHKIAFISEDIAKTNLMKDIPIAGNISLANLKNIKTSILLNIVKEKKVAINFIRKLLIKINNLNQNVLELSSGNQQKVVLSKWIFNDSLILIMDEPTKGLDKCSKIELYNLMNKYVLEGGSIILASSDFKELMGMCDKILVLFDGKIVKTLEKDDFSEEKIVYYASGGT